MRCAEPRLIVNYPRSHHVLLGISVSLPLEVPIDMAAWYKFVRDSARKANNGFKALEGGSAA
jgi:hypothetical protein